MTHPPAGAEPIVRLRAVTKVFVDAASPTHALGPISLDLLDGSFTAIVGPSGSGKSTLLRLIADLTPPTAGGLHVCGQSPARARERRLCGFVFQTPVMFDWRTVQGNVELPLELAGEAPSARRERALAALEFVGLAGAGGLRPRQLSGGMQQRAAIARALVVDPRLLLMDEPFAALDEIAREHLNLTLLRIWQDKGVTVLFVTHSVEEAVFLADRVLVLTPRPGQVRADLEVKLARPRTGEMRSSEAYFEAVSTVRAALRLDAEPTLT